MIISIVLVLALGLGLGIYMVKTYGGETVVVFHKGILFGISVGEEWWTDELEMDREDRVLSIALGFVFVTYTWEV